MRPIQHLEAGFQAELKQFGLIRLSGPDATGFIHRQLSNDIAGLNRQSARFAGYLTPQGLLFATALVWKQKEDVFLLVARDIVASLIERLQKYILRSRVQTSDESETFSVYGLGGKGAAGAIASLFEAVPDMPYGKTENPQGDLIRTSDAFNSARYLLVTPEKYAKDLTFQGLTQTTDEDWELGDIKAGIPQIYAATQNRFLPQTLNMEEVNGLCWSKGCFPGRGSIARAALENVQKEQMLRMHAQTDAFHAQAFAGMGPGNAIFSPLFPETPSGTVVRAARQDEKRLECLAVIEKEALTSGVLHLGSLQGPRLIPD